MRLLYLRRLGHRRRARLRAALGSARRLNLNCVRGHVQVLPHARIASGRFVEQRGEGRDPRILLVADSAAAAVVCAGTGAMRAAALPGAVPGLPGDAAAAPVDCGNPRARGGVVCRPTRCARAARVEPHPPAAPAVLARKKGAIGVLRRSLARARGQSGARSPPRGDRSQPQPVAAGVGSGGGCAHPPIACAAAASCERREERGGGRVSSLSLSLPLSPSL
eukprot:CAMPEP_0179997932 /NCGR_PEP_ID=MMETSP0984-20121128/8401_1 /TAXON_ID=483367 /ORGANISM="non described non described, Strain CCMP 2436" /LENGTH=220 /DNA_ID=CAMNT_0021917561 /DNA_START=436 /DNA_END=1099 /DNA_ORIENTATION=-